MKIKEIEEQTGITKANIRFYESKGLISPNRGANGYRTYDESHVQELRRIRLLRSLGLSIESIKALSDDEITLTKALTERRSKLPVQHQELTRSERIIDAILDSSSDFRELDPEAYLSQLDCQDKTPTRCDVNVKPLFRMRRLCARTLDFTLYNLFLYLCFPSLFQSTGFHIFLIIGEVLTFLVMEPILLSSLSTTPGKFIFGISITNLDGRKLSYGEALNRTLLVLQHGLGFCAPFLKEYMQVNSYITTENDGELIWEQTSELNVRDAKAWRYPIFILLFLAAMAYPAKMEYTRILQSNMENIKHQGETPFLGDYAVDEVLYSAESNREPLPLIRLSAEGMRFNYSGNTSEPYEWIGEFEYAPPADDPAAGVWELKTGTNSDDLYRLTVNDTGDVTLDHYVNLTQKSSWKLILLDSIWVEFKNNMTRAYFYPEWFENGDYGGKIEVLKPRRFGSEFTITLIPFCEMPETITIKEEIHHAYETIINNVKLKQNESGSYSFIFPNVNEDGTYVVYRIEHANGEIIFCVLC